jgi:acyl carrier protein
MSERRQKIKELIVNRMNLRIDPSTIADNAPIFGMDENSLGLDSIDALDLVVGIYEQFDVEVQDSDMHIFESVATIDAFIEKKLAVASAT